MTTKRMREITAGDVVLAIGVTELLFPVTVTQAFSGDGGRSYFMRGTLVRPNGQQGHWLPTAGMIESETVMTVEA